MIWFGLMMRYCHERSHLSRRVTHLAEVDERGGKAKGRVDASRRVTGEPLLRRELCAHLAQGQHNPEACHQRGSIAARIPTHTQCP